MKKLRRPNHKKKSKEAQKELSKRTAQMVNHPKECCMCGALFERSHETVKSWQVVVREGRVRLACENCWDLLQQTLEKYNED